MPDFQFYGRRAHGWDTDSTQIADHKAILKMFYDLEMTVNTVLTGKRVRDGRYPYIPWGHLSVASKVAEVIKKEGWKSGVQFLEVGCALGTNLKLVHEVCKIEKPEGIEIHKLYARFAESFCQPFGVIHRMNAMKFKNYHKFDIIYMWSPFEDRTEQAKLNRLVLKNMREGATLIHPEFNSGTLITCKKGDNTIRWKDKTYKFDENKIRKAGKVKLPDGQCLEIFTWYNPLPVPQCYGPCPDSPKAIPAILVE